MDIREVCLTAICANEDGQKAIGDISTDDLKRQLVGSHYRLYDLEMETEDISGYPAVSFNFFVRGGFGRDSFKTAARFLSKYASLEGLAVWGLGWDGSAIDVPDDKDKKLIASWHWTPYANKLLERVRERNPSFHVDVHTEVFDPKEDA